MCFQPGTGYAGMWQPYFLQLRLDRTEVVLAGQYAYAGEAIPNRDLSLQLIPFVGIFAKNSSYPEE